MTTTTHALIENSVEIISYAYKNTVPFEQQQQSTQQLSEIIAQFKGFNAHQFYYSEATNRWVDMVIWQSKEDAESASEQAMNTPEALAIFALMDETSMMMSHYKKVGDKKIAEHAGEK